MFERQKESPTERRCGAAALCMVLRNFGFEVDQQHIWNAVRRVPMAGGPSRIQTFRLAAYAKERGLDAVVGRLADPASFLQELDVSRGYQLILNHRLRSDSGLGHFTVFQEWEPDEEKIFVHDPQIGPGREIPIRELLELWKPCEPPCEITGNIAVLFFREDCDALTDPEHWNAVFCSETGRRISERSTTNFTTNQQRNHV